MGPDERQRRLLEGPVGPTLLRLALPMMVGIAAVLFFNVVDTFWVGQLGAEPLAAMGFTFPVTMVVTNLTIGLSIGATAAIARVLGGGDRDGVRRLATDALLLGILIVAAVSAAGILTMDPLFRALGASEELLPLIREYMVPWYAGVALLVVPMLGNGAIRATGDTLTPALVMVAAGLANALLDPLFIFGWGPVPAMGLRGAAYATILSYLVGVVGASWMLIVRERMLSFALVSPAKVLESWRAILRIGLPAAGTNLLTPLAAGAVTRIVAGHGAEAVAAYGVGTRVEGLSMIGVFAMTSAVTPFVAQNLGARNGDRIRAAFRFVVQSSLLWGVVLGVILGFAAEPLASLFNDSKSVVDSTVSYLRIVPLSYAPYGVALLVASMFNAMDMPLKATLLAALRLLVLAVPLAALGSHFYGLPGLFGGIVAANVLVGIAGGLLARSVIKVLEKDLAKDLG